MKYLTILIIGLFISCTARRLQRSGAYTVATTTKVPTGTVVTFKNIKGRYLLLSDTLKVNDTVRINVITVKSK